MGGTWKNHLFRRLGPAAFAFAVLVLFAELSGAQIQEPDPELRSNAKNSLLEYQRLIDDGARFNTRGDYRNAEISYRGAVVVCQSHKGINAPSCGSALIRLGLEISNQGRFGEADEIFAAANILVQRSGSSFDIPRYLVYRALDISNRKKFERARRLILAANKRYGVLLKAEMAAIRPSDPNARERLNAMLLEFAHGLYVQAGIARQTGRMREAKLSVQLAKDVTAKVGDVPQEFLDNLDKALETPPPARPQLGQQPVDEQNLQ